MADYCGVSRTNYVRLRDELAYEMFKKLVDLLQGRTVERLDKGGQRVITAIGGGDDGCFESTVSIDALVESGYVSRHEGSELNPDLYEEVDEAAPVEEGATLTAEDDLECDIMYEASILLADNEVLVLQSTGSEKERYVCGYARAIDRRGEEVTVSIDDIYSLARKAFGVEPSQASY